MKGNVKAALLGLVAVASVGTALDANANLHRTDWTGVRTVMVHDSEFGGCLVRLHADMSEVSAGACGQWVAFSCTGELADTETAYRMFETAQIAYLTGTEVRVQVDANRQHNGHCVATRIDLRDR